MEIKKIREQFLAYYEGTLSIEEQRKIENTLMSNPSLKEEYDSYVKTYESIKQMQINKNAPEGFKLDVMTAIENISPVKERSSNMKIKFILKSTLICAAVLFIIAQGYSIGLLDGFGNSELLQKFLRTIDGNFGLSLMILSILFAAISVSIPKDIKRKIAIPLVPAFATIALLIFSLRDSNTGYPSINQIKEVKDQTLLDQSPPDDSSNEVSKNALESVSKPIVGERPKKEVGKLESESTGIDMISPAPEQDLAKVLTNQAPLPSTGSVVAGGVASSAVESFARTPEARTRNVKSRSFLDIPLPPKNNERYNNTPENNFNSVEKEPLSTFSIDVDTGSYSNIRRFLNGSQLPPTDAVRIEEMLNYFKYDYKSPTSKDVPFAVNTELSNAPWAEKHKLLQIGLKGYEENRAELPASNLVFLIDVSGSMANPNKLPLLKQGFKMLVDELGAEDRLAIVVYAGAAGLVLDSKSGSQKEEIISALENLQSGGSTAGGAGIDLAYKIAKNHFIKGGNNRVILATDGDFNVGTSNQADLIKLIEEKRESGIFLSVLGFGTGNYRESMMEQLANKGNGNYSYIDNIREAKKVLVNDFRGTIFTIAKDVKIQIEFNPAYVKAYRLLGYENRVLDKQDFNNDKKDAGELGSGHTVTALYEIVPVGVEFNGMPSVDDLKYQQTVTDPTPAKSTEGILNNELATVKLRYKLPNENTSKLVSRTVESNGLEFTKTSNDFKFASAVAQFGMLLKGSEFKGTSDFPSTLKLAKESTGNDEFGYRDEFIKLVETAELLKR